uniref:Dioxygenase n=1 Tax=Odontella aurita TaxID=265563 RepID=A0A7S4HQS5_9STRA|mmetsp:Transcript_13772/g.40268  ORF Transcript_13772/g.40268 Transcript_13772/m.40268 type:complete len:571 (+) Transcript_13772:343-2055(+)
MIIRRFTSAFGFAVASAGIFTRQGECFSPAGSKPKRSFLHQLDRVLSKFQNPEEQLKDYLYLNGNYAPVSTELVNAPVEVVEGALPPELDGLFARNGPNPVKDRLSRKYHWFDGHAMVHNLRVRDGRAYYTNQFVPSARYRVEKEMDEDFFPGLGEYSGVLGLIKILFHPTMVREKVSDLKTVAPPNTNFFLFRDRFYALNEASVPLELRVLEDGRLEPVGYELFGGALDYPMSAHPKIDSRNGDLLFHGYAVEADLVKEHGTMKVGRLSACTGEVESFFNPLGEDYVTFAHNMMHTDNYMIVYDCNVHFDAAGMFDGGPFFRTKDGYNLRFGLVPKNATGPDEVVWVDTGNPGAVVHPLNSWEEPDGTIVIWTPFCRNLLIDLESEDINEFLMVEFRIDPATGRVTRETIDNSLNVEFSDIPSTGGSFERFGYTAIQDLSTAGEGSFSGFCVWDMAERELRKAVYYREGDEGGEPIAIKADDGSVYVGVHVHNKNEDQSYFLLFDGESEETDCLIARLKLPQRVPFGFHGVWVSGKDLRSHFAHHEGSSRGERAAYQGVREAPNTAFLS